LVLPDEGGRMAVALEAMFRKGVPVFVPAHWGVEVANGVLMAERRRRLTPADAAAALNFLRQLPVSVDDGPATRAFGEVSALARQHGLTAYDAAYLELAMRRRAALATLDLDLRKAAMSAGVALMAG
jgi:predicted nucleic acid-binding protein